MNYISKSFKYMYLMNFYEKRKVRLGNNQKKSVEVLGILLEEIGINIFTYLFLEFEDLQPKYGYYL